MVLTWIMTLAAFVIIFVEIGEWSTETIHASLGLATTILCFIQPFMAAVRPNPGTPKRALFNWAHWFVGNAAHICASECRNTNRPEKKNVFVTWYLSS